MGVVIGAFPYAAKTAARKQSPYLYPTVSWCDSRWGGKGPPFMKSSTSLVVGSMASTSSGENSINGMRFLRSFTASCVAG